MIYSYLVAAFPRKLVRGRVRSVAGNRVFNGCACCFLCDRSPQQGADLLSLLAQSDQFGCSSAGPEGLCLDPSTPNASLQASEMCVQEWVTRLSEGIRRHVLAHACTDYWMSY